MARWHRPAVVSLSALALFLAALGLGYLLRTTAPDVAPGSQRSFALIREAYEQILTSSEDPPSSTELARGAIKGMAEVLQRSDPYAIFYPPAGYRSVRELTSGEFSGIGVFLKERAGRLQVASVLPASPARAAGLQRGDVITSVDGDRIESLSVDETVARIKGPEGTRVTIGIERDGEQRSFTMTRRTIDLPNLTARMQDHDLAYVRLFGFANGAGEELRDEVARLVEKGAEGLLLDLRGNPGGLFSEAIEVASLFIEDGEIVTYSEPARPDVVYDAQGDAFEDLPLVVLIDDGSASAAEIVAGALKDRGRALLVGTTTYGKASVQQIFPLSDESALKITTAAYVTPHGRDINGRGIEPDHELEGEPRVQKARALQILKRIVVSAAGAQG